MSLPAPDDKRRFVEQMFDRIAPRYDLVNRIMTLGIDRAWRRQTVRSLDAGRGATVLDLGCGTGDLCAGVLRQGAHAVGVDVSARMLALAQRNVPGARFVRADAQRLPFPDAAFDAVVSSFALRNFGAIPDVLAEAARVLRPGGRLAILEVDVPRSRVQRAFFNLYFGRVVPWIGALVSRGYAYRYLAASTVYLPEPRALEALLCDAGFVVPRRHVMRAGMAQLVTARRANESSASSPRTLRVAS